jgi:hypothetical protein
MTLLKSTLLASAAGLSAVGPVHAADLPIKKAAPIEYVRVCSAYGAGFFYIPGTDTCLRLSGRARFDSLYQTTKIRTGGGGDQIGYVGLARFNVDARTQTDFGTLRAFLRLDVANRNGPFVTSASRQREGQAFPGLGADSFGRAQTYVNVDKAFIQFAGLTAGRASSFFDFYAHDFELIGNSASSDVYSTNLIAYTAAVGNGLSFTLSVEDPLQRRQPIFGSGAAFPTFSGAFVPFAPATFVAPLIIGPNAITAVDVTQKSRLPDFVGVMRYDAAWGSFQLSGSVHEINSGSASGTSPIAATAAAGAAITAGTGISPVGRASNAYGYAFQGGVKVNLPFISPGDTLYLQGAYGEGAMSYTGYMNYNAPYDALVAGATNGSTFQQYFADAVLNPATGRLELSTTFTVVASFLHYWSPQWRSAAYGSYGEVSYQQSGRNALAAIGFGLNNATLATSPVLRDNNQITAGASLIWSPVKDLDIGVETMYIRSALNKGVTPDISKNSLKFTNVDDTAQVRFRVQRDF